MSRYRAHEVAQLLQDRIGRPREVLLRVEVDERGRATGFLVPSIETEADYRAHAERCLSAQGKGGALSERLERPAAFVDHGRWLVQCDCGSGAVAWPELELAICCECGSMYQPTFPADWKDAEAALLARGAPNQRHYFPDEDLAKQRRLKRAETALDLAAENNRRGIGKE